MNISKILIPTCALSAMLAACATKPPEDPAMIQAREAVARLEADPMAQASAGKPLQDARDALAAAESAERDKKPPAEVDHLAYLAQRRAQLGEYVVDENRARQRMAQAQQQRDAVLLTARERETDAARAQAANSQAQAAAALAQARNSQADAQAAQAAALAAAAQAAAAKEELAQLQALQAKQTERGMVLTLGANLLFDSASDVLKPGADDSLTRVADFLSKYQGIDVRVEGHTDSVGTDSYNDALSERRAHSVARSLQNRGVDSGRIQPVGRGKNLPIATNATAEGRQANRRVEIIFSDDKGKFVSAN